MVLMQRLVVVPLLVFFCFGVFAFSAWVSGMNVHTATGTEVQSLCPLMGMTPGCASIFDHISHWQFAFASTLTEIVLLIAIAFVLARFLVRLLLQHIPSPRCKSQQVSNEPTLFQRLFSQGILNPKIP